jgi:hypothetical protein
MEIYVYKCLGGVVEGFNSILRKSLATIYAISRRWSMCEFLFC